MLRRLLLCLAATGAAFGISLVPAQMASAQDICVTAEAEYPIPATVSQKCVTYWDAVVCTTFGGDEAPLYEFYVQVCAPRPTEPDVAP